MNTAVCLQHVPFEGPGVFHAFLRERGYRVKTYVVPDDGIPNDPGDVLLVMGGPMSVNDPHPWIAEEIAFIQRAINLHIPMLGVCLGAQLFARALGANVWPGPHFEIGFTPVSVTGAGQQDPVFRALPFPLMVFQWHGEGFDAPPNATVLATSNAYPVQAFRYGATTYGLLFHVELDEAGIHALCRACPDDVRRGGGSPDTIAQDAKHRLPLLHSVAHTLIDHLTGLVQQPHRISLEP